MRKNIELDQQMFELIGAIFECKPQIQRFSLSNYMIIDDELHLFCERISHSSIKLQALNPMENQFQLKSSAKKPMNDDQKSLRIMFKILKGSVKHLDYNLQLKCLDLSCNHISNKFLPFLLQTIEQHFPFLRILDLSHNYRITSGCLSIIRKSNLKSLMIDVSFCNISLKKLKTFDAKNYNFANDLYLYMNGFVRFENENDRIEYDRNTIYSIDMYLGKNGSKWNQKRKKY